VSFIRVISNVSQGKGDAFAGHGFSPQFVAIGCVFSDGRLKTHARSSARPRRTTRIPVVHRRLRAGIAVALLPNA
jgi:hypothetical protein